MTEQTLPDLLSRVQRKPTYAAVQAFGNSIKRMGVADRVKAEGWRQVRVAILSPATIEPMEPFLQIGCMERQIRLEVFFAGFNQVTRQILQASSALYEFRPDICFLHMPPDALVPDLEPDRLAESRADEILAVLESLIRAFRSRSTSDLVLSNFVVPIRFPFRPGADRAREVYLQLNGEIACRAAEFPGVYVLDFDRLASFHGKESLSDPRLRYHAGMALGPNFLPKLAASFLSYILAIKGLARKCLVLDLDDTLWGGVVGEDGVDGIQLGGDFPGRAFLDFQQGLLELRQEGFLLAINSRNNMEDAMEALERHPAMLLRPHDFAAMEINWRSKVENVDAIARKLNLTLESLVFIDDNPAERAQMRQMMPQVLTPEWPADPASYRAALESLPDFANISPTREDSRRGESYLLEGKRDLLRRECRSFEEYLAGLQLRIEVRQARNQDLPRVWQLFQKTNQFNLTTRRYSRAEVEVLAGSPEFRLYVLGCRDAFGDYGLVGVALVALRNRAPGTPEWLIDSFLLSCRALGRTIEQGFLSAVLSEAKKSFVRFVVGEYMPTAKNVPAANFYSDAGFHKSGVEGPAERWETEVDSFRFPKLPWLSFETDPISAPAAT